MSPPLLEIRGLVKDYQSLRPLRVRELAVAPGAVLTLTGFDAPAAEVFVHLRHRRRAAGSGRDHALRHQHPWHHRRERVAARPRPARAGQPSGGADRALSVLQNVDDAPHARRRSDRSGLQARRGGAGARSRDPGVRLGAAARSRRRGVQPARAPGTGRRARARARCIAEHPSAALPRDAVARVAGDVARVAAARGAPRW